MLQKGESVRVVAIKLLFSFIFSFLVSCYLIPFLCRLAVKIGAIDLPDGKIKLHEKATPSLGGIAVYWGFISALALTCPFESSFNFLIIGITFLLFLGFVDDLITLAPYQKFFGQFIAALCFIKGGFHLKAVFFHSFFNVAFSAFWILLVINAFNLIDVMDGLVAITATSAAFSFFVLAVIFKQWAIAIILASFIGGVFGFFVYNRPPAKIYLGDAGSLFIGGFFAAVPFFFHWGEFQPLGFFAPAIILGIPILEVATLVVIRTYKGIPFYIGSHDHFSQYLQRKGWRKMRVLLYVLLLSLVEGAVALLFVLNLISFGVVVFSGGMFLLIWFLVLCFARTVATKNKKQN